MLLLESSTLLKLEAQLPHTFLVYDRALPDHSNYVPFLDLLPQIFVLVSPVIVAATFQILHRKHALADTVQRD